MRKSGLLPAALLLLAAGPQAREGSVKTGEHYQVRCTFDNDAIAASALEYAEAAWTEAAEIAGAPKGKLDRPMVIHLHRTIESYQKAEMELAGGQFRDNNGFTSAASKECHLAIVPPVSDEALQLTGLPALTRRLIAHEAVHLVAYRTLENANDHPAWLSEGGANWVSEQVMIRRKESPGIERHPFSSTWKSTGRKLLAEKTLPPLRSILQGDMGGLNGEQAYAVCFLLYEFLKEGKRAAFLKGAQAEARTLGVGADFPARLFSRLEKAAPAATLDAIEKEFQAHLQAAKPEWEEVYRSLDAAGESWTQLAFPDVNAIAWRTEPAGKPPYRLSGTLQRLPGKGSQMNILLGRNDDGFVSVAVFDGGLSLFRYHSKGDRWELLAEKVLRDLLVERVLKFTVAVTPGRIKVGMEGVAELDQAIDGVDLSGPWGLGAQAGTAGRWRSVKLSR